MHLLTDELSPDDNWKKVWADPAITEWMKKTRGVYLTECYMNDWVKSKTLGIDGMTEEEFV